MPWRRHDAAAASRVPLPPAAATARAVGALLVTESPKPREISNSLNYQLRKVTKARGHFPTDDAAVKLVWLAIINIEDKRAARREQDGKTARPAQRLIEGQRVMGRREAVNELDRVYPGRLR